MKIIQNSFVRGEIAPALYGRTDIKQYQSALKTALNTVIHQYGGVSNRPGQLFIAPCKDHAKPPRLIPFQFKTTDTHIIELGDQYIRFIRNDGLISDKNVPIEAITNGSVAEVTSTAHGLDDGDTVFISDVVGMPEVNNRWYIVANKGTDTFDLVDQLTGAFVDSSTWGVYSSAGDAFRIYEIASPYTQLQLRDIRFVQTADVITLTHPDHPPRELRRNAVDDWALVDIVFTPAMAFPRDITSSGGTGPNAFYTVTAIGSDGEESLSGIQTTAATISGITNDNPAVVTTGTHGYDDGDVIYIEGIVGMEELNGRRFTIDVLSSTTFALLGEDSTNYGTWGSGGSTYRTFFEAPNDTNVTIAWAAVTGATRYRVFRREQGVFGFIGSSVATSFADPGTIIPDLSDTPPSSFEPFRDNNPTAVGFHQQRMVYGGSTDEPDTTYYSVIGDFNNFTHSVPFQADDSFSTTLASGQINDIRHYASIGRDLIIFTSGQEWVVRGSVGGVGFSIDTIEQMPQTSFGINHMPPIPINTTLLFVNDTSNAVQSVNFSFERDSYVGTDLSLYVPHLFLDKAAMEWGMAHNDEYTVYIVMDDGSLLHMTYNEEQEVLGWARWATQGFYHSVACIRPSITSRFVVPYFVVERSIDGKQQLYIERLSNRQFINIEDAFFVDSGLSLDSSTPVDELYGLYHLRNMDVTILADGNVISGATVDQNGHLVLDRNYSVLHIGLGYTADIATLPPEFPIQGNTTAQSVRSQVSRVTVRFEKSRGLLIGMDEDHLVEMKQREFEVYGEPTKPLTGDKEIAIPAHWRSEGGLLLRQPYPLPLTVLAIIQNVEIGENR